MSSHLLSRLLIAGLVTGVTDGLFSSTLAAFAYGSTVTRLWQGVASTLLGASAFDGGLRTAAVGLLMHFGVAFAWSAVFLVLLLSSSWVRGRGDIARWRADGGGDLRPAHLGRDVVRDRAAVDAPPPGDQHPLVDPVLRPHPVRGAADRFEL
jgi:hypothetical protein